MVSEEIFEAQNRAFYVGQYLGLPVFEAESICKRESEARDQLYSILLECARRGTLTWARVADTMRTKMVGLPQLAKRIEERHCQGSSVPTLPKLPQTAPSQPTEVSYIAFCV